MRGAFVAAVLAGCGTQPIIDCEPTDGPPELIDAGWTQIDLSDDPPEASAQADCAVVFARIAPTSIEACQDDFAWDYAIEVDEPVRRIRAFSDRSRMHPDDDLGCDAIGKASVDFVIDAVPSGSWTIEVEVMRDGTAYAGGTADIEVQ